MTSPNPARDEAVAHLEKAASLLMMHDYVTTARQVLEIRKLLSAAKPPAIGVDAVARTSSGCFDKDGNELFVGDRVRYRHEGSHTKREYWNPEYEIIFDAPCFSLKHIGGGKDGGSHLFILKHGGGNGDLELIQRGPASSPAGGDVREATQHAVELEQCSLFVDSPPLAKAMTDAAKFLRALSAPTSVAEPVAITARYTNWRGETEDRTFIPHRVLFGSNEWHPEPQVLIEATDCEKGALRTFAASGFATPPAPAAVDGKRVRALEWAHLDNGSAWAHTRFGISYHVTPDGSWCERNGEFLSAGGTLDEAKAAAQADYEARIRACLATDKEGA